MTMLTGNAKQMGAQPLFNKKIAGFFIRLFILFSIWFVCYSLFLRPKRIIDRPVTVFITMAVVQTINVFSPNTAALSWQHDPVKNCTHLVKDGGSVFSIYDVCNGIDIMFIYVGILMLLPGAPKRKAIFSVAGVAIIILVNIIRISLLYFIYNYKRSAFDFSHHYLFTLSLYILIVYGWMFFIKKNKKNEQTG